MVVDPLKSTRERLGDEWRLNFFTTSVSIVVMWALTDMGSRGVEPNQCAWCSTSELWRPSMATILWILAVILVIAGIFAIIRKQLIWGIVLIVVGLLVGPGGVSVFT